MGPVTTKRENKVKSVARALLILEAFTLEKPTLSLNEISQKTGFYKSAILRQMNTFIEAGYVVRDPENKRYRLGTKAYLLGQIFLHSSSLLNSAEHILNAVANELRETAAIFVVDGHQRLCLTMVYGPRFIRATHEPGQKLPIHAGASGKVLLAFSNDSLFERVVEKTGLETYTQKTITNLKKFREELKKINKNGFALSLGERVSSAAAAAVPVFDATGNLACSLSVTGPIDRFIADQIPNMITVLQESSAKLSGDLGYLGDYWKKLGVDVIG